MEITEISRLFWPKLPFMLPPQTHAGPYKADLFCCENTAGNEPRASGSPSPQPSNLFDYALFLITQNALWGYTLSVFFLR